MARSGMIEDSSFYQGKSSAKELAIISGKGGTGKTSMVASFATLSRDTVIADCDLTRSHLFLVIEPHEYEKHLFGSEKKARIIDQKCSNCGTCYDICRFNAIIPIRSSTDDNEIAYRVNPLFCEGCEVCVRSCPSQAIVSEPCPGAGYYICHTRYGPMVYAELSVYNRKLAYFTTVIRDEARKLAGYAGINLIIINCPSGISQTVASSIKGAHLALIVVEPTITSNYHLNRALELTDHLNIPTIICINKWDINPKITEQIEAKAHSHNFGVAGRIRYDDAVSKSQVLKCSVVEYTGAAITQDIKAVWNRVENSLYRLNQKRKTLKIMKSKDHERFCEANQLESDSTSFGKRRA